VLLEATPETARSTRDEGAGTVEKIKENMQPPSQQALDRIGQGKSGMRLRATPSGANPKDAMCRKGKKRKGLLNITRTSGERKCNWRSLRRVRKDR